MTIAISRSNATAPEPEPQRPIRRPERDHDVEQRDRREAVEQRRQDVDRDEADGQQRRAAMDRVEHEAGRLPDPRPADIGDPERDGQRQQHERDRTRSTRDEPERAGAAKRRGSSTAPLRNRRRRPVRAPGGAVAAGRCEAGRRGAVLSCPDCRLGADRCVADAEPTGVAVRAWNAWAVMADTPAARITAPEIIQRFARLASSRPASRALPLAGKGDRLDREVFVLRLSSHRDSQAPRKLLLRPA